MVPQIQHYCIKKWIRRNRPAQHHQIEEPALKERDEDDKALPPVVTSTPSADNVRMGVESTMMGTNSQIGLHEDMDLCNQDDNVDEVNFSINNESTSSSDMTNYRDISMDGVFDLKKIESWSLPSIQRRTAELHRKVNLAKRRSAQFTQGRINKHGNRLNGRHPALMMLVPPLLPEGYSLHTGIEASATQTLRKEC